MMQRNTGQGHRSATLNGASWNCLRKSISSWTPRLNATSRGMGMVGVTWLTNQPTGKAWTYTKSSGKLRRLNPSFSLAKPWSSLIRPWETSGLNDNQTGEPGFLPQYVHIVEGEVHATFTMITVKTYCLTLSGSTTRKLRNLSCGKWTSLTPH